MTVNWRDPGKGPPKAVRDYFAHKGLKPSFAWPDVWREEHSAAFTVAGVMEQDILETLRQAVGEAIDTGIAYEKWRREIRNVLADKGWLGRKTQVDPITGLTKDVKLDRPNRLAIIYDTNMRTARAAGRWDRITDSADALPYLLYVLGPSHVHREEHVTFANLVLPINDPFWRTHYPPNGYGCKCGVRQLSAREARKIGIGTTPDLPLRTWENPRTGARVQVPYGCDPGFDYNAGIDRLGGLRGY